MEKDMFIYIFLLSQISLGLIIPGKGPVYNPLAEFPEIVQQIAAVGVPKVDEDPMPILLLELRDDAGLLLLLSIEYVVDIDSVGAVLAGDISNHAAIDLRLAIEEGIPVEADEFAGRLGLCEGICFQRFQKLRTEDGAFLFNGDIAGGGVVRVGC